MTVDTNIVIGILKAEESLVRWFQQTRSRQSLTISSVTRAEVLSEPKSTVKQLRRIARFLDSFRSVPFDDTIADLVAQLRRRYPKLQVPDAAIAATALHKNVPLVSRDRVFQKISELELIVP